MTIKLYCFGESGHSYKVALGMTLAGVEWQPVFVDFFNGEARSEAFHQINPMGECPVYVEETSEGELLLTQSGVILDHIAKMTGKFAGESEADRREVLRWVLWDNHKMSSQVGMTRFLMNYLPEEKRPAEVIAFMKGRLKGAFKTLDTQLATREWVAGTKEVSMADLSCCSYLFYPEDFGFERADWPHIDAWLGRISSLPGWKHPYDLMPRSAA